MNRDSSIPMDATAEAEAPSDTRPPIPAHHFEAWLVAHLAGATIASFVLVWRNAADEPYISFRGMDALFQVGCGCALILVWIYLIAGTLYGVTTRRLSRGWLWLLPWAAIWRSITEHLTTNGDSVSPRLVATPSNILQWE